ncbi:MAG: BNR/Asp-box repeat protein [candidate division BRC1 bacterium ADurb.BinA364]|nr:MAG: BNR/Asp-box repeat protein [candidate division BRC1 bacterium ADurb.BinA364]
MITSNRRTEDDGATWRETGQKVIAFRGGADSDNLWGCATEQIDNRNVDVIYASTDFGARWEKIVALPNRMGGIDTVQPIFAAHPTDENRFATLTASGEIVFYNGDEPFVPKHGPKALSGREKNHVHCIAFDATHPNLVYVSMQAHSAPCYFRSEDGGKTWTDITYNLPRTLGEIAVHPLTGDVIIGRFHGAAILAAPAGYRYSRPSLIEQADFPILHYSD